MVSLDGGEQRLNLRLYVGGKWQLEVFLYERFKRAPVILDVSEYAVDLLGICAFERE